MGVSNEKRCKRKGGAYGGCDCVADERRAFKHSPVCSPQFDLLDAIPVP